MEKAETSLLALVTWQVEEENEGSERLFRILTVNRFLSTSHRSIAAMVNDWLFFEGVLKNTSRFLLNILLPRISASRLQ